MFQSAPHFTSEAIGRYQVSIRASLQQRGEPPTRLTSPARAAFQSAPHFSSEANEIRIRDESRQARFNPRLTSAARRTRRHVEVDRRTCVSIRASLQQRGEPGYGRPDASRTGFQSAPHFSSEANAGTREPYRRVRSFNPRLTSAARRTGTANEIAITNGVSIRASLQQRGEHAGKSPLNFSSSAFQSAPHFSSEANGSIISTSRRSRSFQSAPHFSSEANAAPAAALAARNGVSIRASLQQRGELFDIGWPSPLQAVSIRASLQQRGERNRPYWHSTVSLFQSAPHFSSEANATARPITSASLSSPKIGRCGP